VEDSKDLVGYHKGIEVFSGKMGMGGRAEVYDGEMVGLTLGAKMALKFVKNHPEITRIYYFVDNSAAEGAIFDPKPQPGQLYVAKFHRGMVKFLDDNATCTVEINWCPSHCKIQGNDRADKLAKEATQMAWNAPIRTSRAYALRHAKATTQAAWARDWQKTPKRGRFAISNRIPPSLNPTTHFTELQNQREVFSCLIQCCTGHTYTGEFRRQLLPKKSVACECGETLQTHEHILRTCTHYTNHRESLQNGDREIALPELLGTPKGITALTEFLKESGAFTFTRMKYLPKDAPTFEDKPEPPDIDSEDEVSDSDQ
jgi:hypothetical protein